MADEVKENNKQLVCEIKIDAEMMQKIVDEKVAQIELDIQGIRAKAIDEFASVLANKDNIVKHDIDELMESSGNFDLACNYLRAYIDEIAEQLKEIRNEN